MSNSNEYISQRNSEEFFMRLIESLPLGVLAFNSEGRITYVNNNFLEFCVFHQIEINPSNTISIFEENLFPENPLLEQFKKLREGFSFEEEIEKAESPALGKIIIMVKASPLYKGGEFEGGILILQDIKVSQKKKLGDVDVNWKEILQSSLDLFLITDIEGNIKFSTGKKLNRFAWRITPFEKYSINSLFPKEISSAIYEQMKRISESVQSIKFNLQLIIKNRSYDYECEIVPRLDESNKVKLFHLRFTDISSLLKSVKAQEQKISDTSKSKSYIEHVTLPVFVVDMNGRIIFWNQGCQNTFGLSEFQAEGKYFIRLIGITEPKFFDSVKEQLSISKQAERTFTFVGMSGGEETMHAVFTLVEEQEPYIVIACQNISDKIQLEKKLRGAEENFERLIHASGNLVFRLDSFKQFTYANKPFLDTINIPEDKIFEMNFVQLLEHESAEENILDKLSASSESGKQVEITLLLKNREKIHLTGFLKKYLDSNGEESYEGHFQNITTFRKTAHQFEILTALVNSSRDGILIEQNKKIIQVNDSFLQMFRYSRNEDVIGKAFIELVSEEDVKRISEYLHLVRRKMDAPERFEFIGKREDSAAIYLSSSVSQFEIGKNNFLVFIVRDITESKKSQQVLRESDEKFRSIIENIDDFMFTYGNVKGKLLPTFFTSNVKKMTGYDQKEFLSDKKLFFKIIHPDDINSAKQQLKNLLKSRIKNSDELEFRIINRYGSVVWTRNKITVVRDTTNEVVKVYGIVSDISIHKKAEEDLEQSRQALIKLNETKDRFLSIVSHDLRTPFSSILGFTDLLLNDETLTETERKQYVKFIRESSTSMLALVNSLLDWNRLQSGRVQFEPAKIFAYPIVERSISSLAGNALAKNIEIKSSIPKDVQIFADENLILQVFNNLISNAIKFTRPNGIITITVSPSQQLRFVEFAVQDTGIGIKPENIKKLFTIESKFTTDGTSGEKGSGLGLTIVKDIIQKHGGTIWAESEPGKGSTFKFTLPIASAEILLVDDNKTDRFLYSKILRNLIPDYSVAVASNGKEALDKIKKSPPALVISDHNMPVMNGVQLVQEVQKLDPKSRPPVIILSGDIDRNAINDYGMLGIDYIFQKPVNLANFKQAMERTIRKGLLGE